MKRYPKAVSPLISFVLVILISAIAISIVYFVGKDVIQRATESTVFNEGMNNMNLLGNVIREVASEGIGSLRTIQLLVSDGKYRADNSSSSVYFDYTLKAGIVSPGTVTKQGDIQIIAGGAGASATDTGSKLILENEILKVTLNKSGDASLSGIVDGVNNGMVGWWHLDEGTGTATDDSSGSGKNGTLKNGTGSCGSVACPSWTDGKFSKALNFDGVGDYVQLGFYQTKAQIQNGVTWSAWVNTAATTGTVITQTTDGAGSLERAGGLVVRSNKAVFVIYNGTTYLQPTSTTSVNDGKWHLITGTYDSSNYMRIYVDGVLEDTQYAATVEGDGNSVNLRIGYGDLVDPPVNKKFFNGTIDDVRIYNRTLSANEISSLYKAFWTKYNIQSIQNKKTGKTITPNDSSIVIGNDLTSSYGVGYSKLLVSGSALSQAEATYHVNSGKYNYNILYSLPSSVDYLTVQVQNTTNTNNTFILRYNISNLNSENLKIGSLSTVPFNTTKTYTVDNDNYTSLNNFNLGLVAWWKLDEGSGNVTDSSGNGYTGIIGAGNSSKAPVWTTGKFGNALQFDGTDDYVNFTSKIFINVQNNFAMSIWVNPTGARSGVSGISGQRYAIFPSQGGGEFGIGTEHAGAGISIGTDGIGVYEHSDGYIPEKIDYTTAISGWTHIVVVYSNAIPSLYVNGVFISSGSQSSHIPHPSHDLGETGAGYGYFKGLMDEVRIYNRPLSANEVQDLYNNEKNDHVVSLDTPYAATKNIYYNASDGTWRNISELSQIGQGGFDSWTVTNSNDTYTNINPGLAGGDGYDYGIRDNTPGGSFYLSNTGSYVERLTEGIVPPYCRDICCARCEKFIDIKNDFVGIKFRTSYSNWVAAVADQTIYDASTGTRLYATDEVDLLYYSGTPGGGIFSDNSGLNSWARNYYFYDWRDGNWKIWMNTSTNVTHGMPDWLDPKFKQEFKWRTVYTRTNYASINFTYLMTAHDPFIRVFVDTVNASSSNNITIAYTLGQSKNLVDEGLRIYTPFEEGMGTTAYDYSNYQNNGTIGGNALWITNSSCKFGNCLNFDSSDDDVTFGNASEFNAYPMTITFWMKTGLNTSGKKGIVNKYASGIGYVINLENDNVGAWYLRGNSNEIYTGGDSGAEGMKIASNIADNNWHFIAWTVDSTGGKGYLDGVLTRSLSWTGTAGPTNTTEPLLLGNYPGFSRFNGTLDEFRLYYNVSLTGAQIWQLYNLGQTRINGGNYYYKNASVDNVTFNIQNFKPSYRGNYSTPVPSYFNLTENHTLNRFVYTYIFNSTNNKNFMFALGKTGNLDTNSKVNQFSKDKTTGFSNESVESLVKSALSWYELNETNPHNKTDKGNGIVQHNFTNNFYYDGGATGVWHFEETSGSKTFDSSGNNNVGTLTSITSVTGKYSNAFKFDGSSSYIDIIDSPSNNITGNQITIEAWINVTGSGYRQIVARSIGAGASDRQYGMYVGGVSNGLGFDLQTSAGRIDLENQGNVPLNVWTHVAVVYDGSQMIWYINGTRTGYTSQNGNIVSKASNVNIGRFVTATSYFNGTIDEVRIYPKALIAGEIKEHYNREVSKYYDDFNSGIKRNFGVEDSNTSLQSITLNSTVLHLRFNDDSTVNVTDISGYGNNGASLNGTVWVNNASCRTNFGGCMNFDGINDYIDVSNSASLNLTNKFTISAWINLNNLTGLHRIVSKRDLTQPGQGYGLAVNGQGLRFTTYNVQDYDTSGNYITQTNHWYHVALVFNSSNTANFYVDGVLKESITGASPAGTNPSDLFIGVYKDNTGAVTEFWNGTLDEVMIINRSLTPDEVQQLYVGGYNRTIGSNTHRVASYDDLSSISFNLTDHDTSSQQDYDQRLIRIDGGLSTASRCFTPSSISSYFACSYNSNNFAGLIYSGQNSQFINTCFSNSSSDYTLNLTSNSLQKLIIPVGSGDCNTLSNLMYQVNTYGQPTSSFGTYSGLGSGIINLLLKLNYPKIVITGDGNSIGRGTNKICIEKTGVSNNLPVVNLRRC